MKLVTDWNIFRTKIFSLIENGEHLRQSINFSNNYDEEKAPIIEWKNELLSELRSSFDESENELIDEVQKSLELKKNIYRTQVANFGRTLKSQTQDDDQTKLTSLEQNLKALLNTLKYFLKFLSSADAVIFPDKIEEESRSNFTTDQTLNLILEKLYILYDNNYHSIQSILAYNGIKTQRLGEERELIKLLENRGLVRVMYSKDVSAQLTTEGKLKIENSKVSQKANYGKIEGNQFAFAKVVDDILDRLQKLGYGQQIIFDEIEELKELHTKLDKKNFGQVLKGKLIDLSISKLVENDTISYIFEKITNETLRLP